MRIKPAWQLVVRPNNVGSLGREVGYVTVRRTTNYTDTALLNANVALLIRIPAEICGIIIEVVADAGKAWRDHVFIYIVTPIDDRSSSLKVVPIINGGKQAGN